MKTTDRTHRVDRQEPAVDAPSFERCWRLTLDAALMFLVISTAVVVVLVCVVAWLTAGPWR